MSGTGTPVTIAAVIVAAGRSTRMAGLDKQFAQVGGKALLARTIAVFEQSPLINIIVLVLNPDNLQRGRALAYEEGFGKIQAIVAGGARRQDSAWLGLKALAPASIDYVMIHDGARPFVTPQIIADGLALAQQCGACTAAVPVKDTIKIVDKTNSQVLSTPARDTLWAVQTPQVFRYDLICAAHQQILAAGTDVTDDAMVAELAGYPVKVFQAAYTNLKITTPDDLLLAQHLLEPPPALPTELVAPVVETSLTSQSDKLPQIRIGQGYDVHQLVPGRPLILGGLSVPFELGLAGHSDADVLTHAIINALLGAARLGDIGRYFPPSDPTLEGISSQQMLKEVYTLITERGWQLGNVDATIVAQKPKLAAYIPAMCQTLAETMGVNPELINVKATTTEKLGFVGRLEGLEAHAVALLTRPPRQSGSAHGVS